MPTESDELLAAEGVHKRFGALVVVDGVDLAVATDEAIGIVGPNGAGKTTLLDILSRRPAAERGDVVHLRGARRHRRRPRAAQRCRLGIGRSHQVPRPFGGMTVYENVLVGATTGGGDHRGREAAYRPWPSTCSN